jgi:hypothetical protein
MNKGFADRLGTPLTERHRVSQTDNYWFVRLAAKPSITPCVQVVAILSATSPLRQGVEVRQRTELRVEDETIATVVGGTLHPRPSQGGRFEFHVRLPSSNRFDCNDLFPLVSIESKKALL